MLLYLFFYQVRNDFVLLSLLLLSVINFIKRSTYLYSGKTESQTFALNYLWAKCLFSDICAFKLKSCTSDIYITLNLRQTTL